MHYASEFDFGQGLTELKYTGGGMLSTECCSKFYNVLFYFVL